MSDPWISVVIPTYNREDSLRLTLDGLGRQTLSTAEFEVVVVDDGSTDGTGAFLADYAATAPFRLLPFTQQNAGPARARNRGMNEACGEVIVLLDDDVEPALDFLAMHARRHARTAVAVESSSGMKPEAKRPWAVKAISQESKTVIIGPMRPDPKRREPVWIAWEHAMLRKQYDSWERGLWEKAGPMNFYSGNASFRREWALAVDGFNEDLKRAEDVDLGWRMQQTCGVDFEYDPRPIGIHRPVRSFESWLDIADSYGRLDVVRARAGVNSWDIVRDAYVTRNIVTRRLADIVLRAPAMSAPLRSILLALSKGAYALGLRPSAIAALSVVYNLRYLQSVCSEMGHRDLRKLIDEG